MSTFPDQYPPSTPPPAPPAAVPPPPPRAWPMVIGIIAIILGALGALGGCVGMAVTPFLRVIEKVVPAGQAPQLEGLAELVPSMLILAFAGLVIAVLLLIGGIGLVRRRRWGMTACLAWAVVKIIFVVAHNVFGYLVNVAQFEQIETMTGNAGGPPLPVEFFAGMGALGACFGIAWGWALPIFMLIWFTRRKIRDEVREWGSA